MKILLTGGGTGGHFYPILAVARALKKIAQEERIFEMELTYFSDDPFDADLLRQEGIRFKKVPAGKARRYFSFLNVVDIFKTLWGTVKAILDIFLDMPDVIFSKGGYASFPALIASRLFRLTVMIHESDIEPGRVNRWAGRFAESVAISFPEAIKYFPEEKTAFVGNPIRSRLLGGNLEEAKLIFGADTAPTILILGGSQGSVLINNVVLDILPDLVKEIRVIHQCGDKNLDSVSKQSSVILEKSEFKDRYHFFGTLSEDELRAASFMSTLIVSRAGGGAIFEIAAWGKPAILIPLARAAQDHQRKNAYAYTRTGAAEVIEEVNLTPHILLAQIKKILSDTARQEKMKEAATRFARTDAAYKIAKEIIALALKEPSIIAKREKIRTRIAPSPTGPLHVGVARSALFNYIFARQHDSNFILRIEDTDRERSKSVFEQDIKDALTWLGITWDEFYRQSDRIHLYEKYLKKLLENGFIFWCPHSQKELSEERTRQMQGKEPSNHICEFRDRVLPMEPGKGILRFKNNTVEDVVFVDVIRGEIRTKAQLLGDFSVAKDFDNPLYNFTVVIDDAQMNISHVIRGEDHISNTPKQILLQEALGFSRPVYAHLPLILGSDRSKLSKRHGATSILEYKKLGYLPEAMVNFMVLLGWHPASEQSPAPYGAGQSLAQGRSIPEKEILSTKEILEQFSLERIQKAGAIFDIEKLNWLNRAYIKAMSTEDLAERLKPYAVKWSKVINTQPEKWRKIVLLQRERLTVLGQIGEEIEYFFEMPHYSKELLLQESDQAPVETLRHLSFLLSIFAVVTDKEWTKDVIEKKVMEYADKEGRGEVLWPLRVALSGRRASPGPFEIAEILGKAETLLRLQKAIELFS